MFIYTPLIDYRQIKSIKHAKYVWYSLVNALYPNKMTFS